MDVIYGDEHNDQETKGNFNIAFLIGVVKKYR